MLHERSFACFSYICDLAENLATKKDIDEEEREFKARSKPQHICITNATSPVAYHMINAIARGDCLGPDVEVSASECNSPWTFLFNRSCISHYNMGKIEMLNCFVRCMCHQKDKNCF